MQRETYPNGLLFTVAVSSIFTTRFNNFFMKRYLLLFIVSLLVKTSCSQTYTFTGNGSWSVAANWSGNIVPPAALPSGAIIHISPASGDSCVLYTAQTISPGASLIIVTGKRFIIAGGLLINNNTASIPSVTICSQVWMTKNLDVRNYRNGDPIPQVFDPNVWVSLTTGAWSWYRNDSVDYAIYGKLYNSYALTDPRGLAPAGWHIPTAAEFTTLSTCLGGDAAAGGALKEAGTAHWLSPNTGATNSSGFTALPAGERDVDGSDYVVGMQGAWWSSTSNLSGNFGGRFLSYNNGIFGVTTIYPYQGASVRFVKD